MSDFETEMKMTFLEEAGQLLSDVEQCFLTLENDPHDRPTIEKIFRLAHNLKGSAKAVGFYDVNTFCHEFESFLLAVKSDAVPVDRPVISLLLRCSDHIRHMVETLRENLSATFDSTALLGELVAMKNRRPDETAASAPATTSAPDESGLTIFEEEPVKPETVIPLAAVHEAASAPTRKSISNVDDGIRVSLARLERLIDAVGEMVILQSVMSGNLDGASHTLRRTAQHMSKVIKEIQDMSMSLRMVKLKPVFQKMQRIVRDTSEALNKNVKFNQSGDETEVDKTVFERITDPLVHLIRNAVDHGLETGEEREAAGKSKEGIINLRAFHQGGHLVLEIEDDGQGLDPVKLRQVAIKRGVLSPDKKISDSEAQELIFLPGFSSKEQVTDVSGRGVGMDVVKTNVQQLGGSISINSKVGKGTCFRIELPLTLAIIDGMIVRAGNSRFVVPLSHVHETVRLEATHLQRSSGLGEVLLLREENLPLYRLGRLQGLAIKGQEATEPCAIVIRGAKQAFAVAIDEIISSAQVVVKQLGREMQGHRGVSGSTILGDGRPALILELTELVAQHGHLNQTRRAA